MKHALTATALLAGLAILAPPVEAQTAGAARGRVVDDLKEPVADAKVVLEYLGGMTRKYEVKTNKNGDYMQVGLSPGRYRFTASKEGYVDAGLEMKISIGLATDIPELEIISVERAVPAGNPDEAVIREKFSQGVELARTDSWTRRRSSSTRSWRSSRASPRSTATSDTSTRSGRTGPRPSRTTCPPSTCVPGTPTSSPPSPRCTRTPVRRRRRWS